MGHASQDAPLAAPAVSEPPQKRRKQQTPKASEEVFEETGLFDTLLEMGLPKNCAYLEDHFRTCKWLVTGIYKQFRSFGRGTTPLRGLTSAMVLNHVSKSWDDPPSRSDRC